jgi:HEAT repeat protein
LLEREDVESLVQAAGFQGVEPDADGHPPDGGMRIREQAVLALGELGPDAGSEAVAGALHDSSDCVRSAAVQVLHSRGEIELLASALSSLPTEGEKSRELAFQAILEHRSSRVARTAARALVRTPGDAPPSDGDVAFIKSLARSEEGRDPAKIVVRELLKALSDDRSEVAERAEELLVGLGSSSVRGLIAELGSDRSPAHAAMVLGRIGDSDAMESLIGALEHRHQEVRLQAAAALGALRDPAAVEPLLRATRDSDYDVRAEASQALDHLGAAGIIVGMSALLRSMVVEAVTSAAELSPPDRASRVVPQISAPPEPWRFREAREATPLRDDSAGL